MNNKRLVIILLIISGVITVYFLISILFDGYWIWGKSNIEYDKTGQVGDFIGGVIGTIISAAGFYFLYLTLNAQRISIIKQEIAFERERFENRFYELIRMHRENVAELKFKSIEYVENSDSYTFSNEIYEGKEVFRSIFYQFVLLTNESKHFFRNQERIFKQEYKDKVVCNPIIKQNKIDLVLLAKVDICYSIIFYGLGSEGLIILRKIFKDRYKEKFINDLLRYLSLKPANDDEILKKWILLSKRNSRMKKITLVDEIYSWREKRRIPPPLAELFNGSVNESIIQNYHNRYVKYYGGHQFRLGHYYRHLYQAIKYVNNKTNIDYAEKYEYIKMLRAQLSTYEQAVLFLNSLCSMGYVWELNPEIKNYQKNLGRLNFELITKFNLIKNLPGETLYGIPFRLFYPNIEYEGEEKNRDNSKYK